MSLSLPPRDCEPQDLTSARSQGPSPGLQAARTSPFITDFISRLYHGANVTDFTGQLRRRRRRQKGHHWGRGARAFLPRAPEGPGLREGPARGLLSGTRLPPPTPTRALESRPPPLASPDQPGGQRTRRHRGGQVQRRPTRSPSAPRPAHAGPPLPSSEPSFPGAPGAQGPSRGSAVPSPALRMRQGPSTGRPRAGGEPRAGLRLWNSQSPRTGRKRARLPPTTAPL